MSRAWAAAPAIDVPTQRQQLALDVRASLSLMPKQLPSKYLYDPLGSALFDAICRLPWYEVTRAERRLLARHAAAIVSAADPALIVELGPGDGQKLAALVSGSAQARSATRASARPLHLQLVDISAAALARAADTLHDLPDTRVTTIEATYEQGIAQLAARRSIDGPAMVVFLGSNIGNFDPPHDAAFLSTVHAALRPGDTLLLGADLVKPEPQLQLAYDDPLGVTAAFNKNLLVRLNSELEADFDLDRFAHRAVWRAEASRIEMHLVSLGEQSVRLPGAHLAVTFADGETIWTESSYKYDPAGVEHLGHRAGFTRRAQWIDEPGRFALTLFSA
jgi:dimethylhistidine N-methyltransferase